MKRIAKYLFIVIVALFLIRPIYAQELRLGLNHNRKIVNYLNFTFKGEIRANLQSSKGTYSIIQPGISYDLTKKITVAGAYRLVWAKNYADEEMEETIDLKKNRVTFDAKYRFNSLSEELGVDYRIRYHYSHRKGKSKSYIRNRIRLKYQNTKRSQFFVGMEPFYYLDDNKLSQIRLSVGNEYKFKGFDIKIYMLLDEIFNDGSLESMHQFGVSIGL
jgi:hypothetical protein